MSKALLLHLGKKKSYWTAIADTGGAFSVRIGRTRESDYVIPEDIVGVDRSTVSRAHLRLFRNDGQLYIEDLDSQNFTWLDHKLVFAPTPIKLPCTVRLGTVLVHISEGAPPKPSREDSSIRQPPSSNVSKTALVSRENSEFPWHDLRGRLQWADALVDLADYAGAAQRAEQLEASLQEVLIRHLGAAEVFVHLDTPIEKLPHTLADCGLSSGDVSEVRQSMKTGKSRTPLTRVALASGMVWLVEPMRRPEAHISIVVALAPSDSVVDSPAREADALVSLMVRLMNPCADALRELESTRASVTTSFAQAPSAQVRSLAEDEGMWGDSEAFQKCLYLAETAAKRYLPLFSNSANKLAAVFFLGESGTGKSALARLIHKISDHRGLPFVELNCAAIPDSLAESELFGYERGAHDKAFTSKPGFFESAGNGTIFLDEIGKTSKDFQSKLLKVLDTGQYMRLGGTRPLQTKCYVILATSEVPEKLCEEGLLLHELWYRIGAFTVQLPPLRDRPQDLPLLVNRRIDQLNAALPPIDHKEVAQSTLDLLGSFKWPGNIRQLMQCIEVAHALTPPGVPEIQPVHLPESFLRAMGIQPQEEGARPQSVRDGEDLDAFTARMERLYVAHLINAADGNLKEVSRRSGKSYQTVHTKLNQFREWLRAAEGPEDDREKNLLQSIAGQHWAVIEKEIAAAAD